MLRIKIGKLKDVHKNVGKHHLAMVIVGTLLVVGIGTVIQNHKTQAASTPITYENKTRASATSKFGFNGFFLEGIVRDKNLNDDIVAIDNVLTATNATWIRFLRGTTANTYVFDLTAPGFGDDSSFSKTFSDNFIVNYATIARSLHVKTDYVINMASHFPTYYGGTANMPPRLRNKTDAQLIAMNVGAVKYLLDNGADVSYIELGNEMYSYNLTQNEVSLATNKTLDQVTTVMKPAMDRYEDLSKQYIAAFNALAVQESATLGKSVNFQYGVPALPPLGDLTKPIFNGPLGNRNIYWNQRVSSIPGVNGLVIHWYSNFGPCKSILSKASFLACENQTSVSDISQLGVSIDRTRATYPGKALWFTEFNAGFGYENDPQINGSGFINSPAHIKYIRDLMTMFKNKNVELYTFHMLFGSTAKEYAIVNKVVSTIGIKINPNAGLYAQPSICGLISPTSSYFSTFRCSN